MAVEDKTWIEEAKNLKESDWFCLAKTIDSLGLSGTEVQGDVLVAGPSYGFAERLLVGTPKSKYRILREEIRSLTLCDYNPELLNCTYLINHWLDNLPEIISAPNGKFLLEAGNYRFIYCDVKSFLLSDSSKSLFDTIMIFCINHTGEELINGLGVLIAKHLRPCGYVMGSGIFPEQTKPFLPGLEIEKLIELDKPTMVKNDGKKNLGFLARKSA